MNGGKAKIPDVHTAMNIVLDPQKADKFAAVAEIKVGYGLWKGKPIPGTVDGVFDQFDNKTEKDGVNI